MKQFLASLRCMTLLFVGVIVVGCTNPNIESLTPDEGPVGTEVAIAGLWFGEEQQSSTVHFNETRVPDSDIILWSSSLVIVRVPSGAETGPVTMQVEGLASNRNRVFTVHEGGETQPSSFGLVVANRQVPGIEAFIREAREPLEKLGDISLAGQGEVEVHGLAWARLQKKIYASVTRNGVRSLLAFAWDDGEFFESTVEGIGFEPAGLMVSPDDRHLWVSNTASESLSAVDTETDQVVEGLSLDILSEVAGFEPLNAAIATDPDADGSDSYLIVVVGNNIPDGKGEVLTFSSQATHTAQRRISNISLAQTRLNGSMSVVAGTGYAYVLGERNGAVSIAFLDILQGQLIHQFDLRADDETAAGLSLPEEIAMPVTEAVSIAVRGDSGELYVSTPPYGVLSFSMPVTSVEFPDGFTMAVDVSQGSNRIDIPLNPTHLAPLLDGDGNYFSILATQSDGNQVVRIDGLEYSEFAQTMSSPTRLSVSIDASQGE